MAAWCTVCMHTNNRRHHNLYPYPSHGKWKFHYSFIIPIKACKYSIWLFRPLGVSKDLKLVSGVNILELHNPPSSSFIHKKLDFPRKREIPLLLLFKMVMTTHLLSQAKVSMNAPFIVSLEKNSCPLEIATGPGTKRQYSHPSLEILLPPFGTDRSCLLPSILLSHNLEP